jgi:hypothetical protein
MWQWHVKHASRSWQPCVNVVSTLRQLCVKVASTLRQHCVKLASMWISRSVKVASELRQMCVNFAAILRERRGKHQTSGIFALHTWTFQELPLHWPASTILSNPSLSSTWVIRCFAVDGNEDAPMEGNFYDSRRWCVWGGPVVMPQEKVHIWDMHCTWRSINLHKD